MVAVAKKNNVDVVSRYQIPNKLPPVFRKSKLLILDVENPINFNDFEKIILPSNEKQADIYLDHTDNKLYLTQFLFDQNLLSEPIQAIALYDLEFLVFVGKKVVELALYQLDEKFGRKEYYLDLFGSKDQVVPKQSETSRKRKYKETIPLVPSKSISAELGIETATENASGSSERSTFCRSPLSVDVFGSMDHDSDDVFHESTMSEFVTDHENIEVERLVLPIKKVKQSMLDKKEAKKRDLTIYKERVDGLITTTAVKRTEIVVPTEQVILTREFSTTDQTICRMASELNDNKELYQSDPIMVAKKEDNYIVVSGNRRVAAYKSKLQKQIWVSEVDHNELSKYKINLFFRNNIGDNDDLGETMNIMGELLNIVRIPISLLSTWSTFEKNWVFENLFSPSSKLRLVLDLFVCESLHPEIKLLSSAGIKFTQFCVREILRKNRQNPVETMTVLQQNWKTENDLKKALKNIKPDLKFILIEKKIHEEVADELIDLYASDPTFNAFVRATDMRSLKKASSQKKLLMEKFEQFKNKQEFDVSRATRETTINISNPWESECEIVFINTTDEVQRVLDENLDIVIISIGVPIPNEPEYVLIVDDKFGMIDQFGRLNNDVSFSIIIKKQGVVLKGREVTDELKEWGAVNRKIYNTAQLKLLCQKFSTFYLDFGGTFNPDYAALVVPDGCDISVCDADSKYRLQKSLDKAKTA